MAQTHMRNVQCVNVSGTMFIVNLQCTGKDAEALRTGGVLVHARYVTCVAVMTQQSEHWTIGVMHSWRR